MDTIAVPSTLTPGNYTLSYRLVNRTYNSPPPPPPLLHTRTYRIFVLCPTKSYDGEINHQVWQVILLATHTPFFKRCTISFFIFYSSVITPPPPKNCADIQVVAGEKENIYKM